MLRKLAVSLVICLLFPAAAPRPAEARAAQVDFPSAELRTAMEQITGAKPVTPVAMARLTGELNLEGRNIDSAEGLQYATHIDRLVLTGNRLTDISPVFQMTWLQRLSVNYNNISDLTGISALKNLEELNVSNNPLGALSEELCAVAGLRRLYAGDIGMAALPAGLPGLAELDRLYLAGNPLASAAGLERLTKLTLLDLSRCALDAVPQQAQAIRGLKYLYLTDNRLTELPGWLGGLPLERLDVSGNFLGDLPASLAGCKTLKQLVISRNAFFRLPDAVTKMTNLEVLMATSNFLTELPPGLKNLKKITRMSFAANDLTSLSSINGMKINYSWQVNFRYNRLNLEESGTKAALRSFHHDGLPQKGTGAAHVAAANAAGVTVGFDFRAQDHATLTASGYTLGAPMLFRREGGGYRLAALGEAGGTAVTDTDGLSQGDEPEYLAALPVVLNRQEPVTVYLEAAVKAGPLAPAPTSSPMSPPEPTPEPTVQATAAPPAALAEAQATARPTKESSMFKTVVLFAGIGFSALVSYLASLLVPGKPAGRHRRAAPGRPGAGRPRNVPPGVTRSRPPVPPGRRPTGQPGRRPSERSGEPGNRPRPKQ